VIPAEAGVFCAIGMLHSNLRRDVSRSLVVSLRQASAVEIQGALETEQQRAELLVGAEWPADVATDQRWYVDLRYPGQLWSVRVDVEREPELDVRSVRHSFEFEYERLYGHIQPEGKLEVTGVGVVVEGHLDHVPPTRIAAVDGGVPPVLDQRRCWLGPDFGWAQTPIHGGADLAFGHVLDGPYLVEAATTTVLGLPGDRLTVRPNGDLEVSFDG
jgi:N-methylhydantoinase A